MPDIFTTALDKIAEGALDTQCHAMVASWNKDGFVRAQDMPAATTGLKLLVGVLFAMLAAGQAAPSQDIG